jgi:hypothetical protein
MTEIHGYIAPRFAAVGDAFAANFANPAFADVGADPGVSNEEYAAWFS